MLPTAVQLMYKLPPKTSFLKMKINTHTGSVKKKLNPYLSYMFKWIYALYITIILDSCLHGNQHNNFHWEMNKVICTQNPHKKYLIIFIWISKTHTHTINKINCKTKSKRMLIE